MRASPPPRRPRPPLASLRGAKRSRKPAPSPLARLRRPRSYGRDRRLSRGLPSALSVGGSDRGQRTATTRPCPAAPSGVSARATEPPPSPDRVESMCSRISRGCARAARSGARGRSPPASPGARRAARSATWREKPAGTSLSCRPRRTAPAAARLCQPRPEAVLAERRVEVDVARGRVEGDARVARAVGAAGTRRPRCRRRRDRVARGGRRGRGTGSRTGWRPGVRDRGQLGAQQPHERRERAVAAEGERRGQQAEGGDPLGVCQAELERDPAAHRVADEMGAWIPIASMIARARAARTTAAL